MSVVVGIDPSLTSAGLAILRDGTPIYLDSIGVDDKVKDWSHRIRRISLQASNIIHWINDRALPDLAVIEQPLTVGPNNSADSYDRYTVFAWVAAGLMSQRVPIAYVHNQTRAKWATGKANAADGTDRGARKRAVLNAVRVTWPRYQRHIKNDDIADALTLAAMGAVYLGDTLPFEVAQWRINGLESVKWPEVVRV